MLPLDELSSGEQQILVLCASVVLANARVLVIEEPEINLDVKNQRLLHSILAEAVDRGQADQIILESHVPSFDGPHVIRFRRNESGATEVVREPSVTEAQRKLARKAREQNADDQWVTPDGYTRLPDNMRHELGLDNGGGLVWFLKRKDRWEAWPEADLAAVLGESEPEEGDG